MRQNQIQPKEMSKSKSPLDLSLGNSDKHINPLASGSLSKKNILGYTPFLWQVFLNNTDNIKELIKQGSNIREVTNEGYSALHMSCEVENIEISELLLKLGLSPKVKNMYGYTPIQVCEIQKKYKSLELLKRYK